MTSSPGRKAHGRVCKGQFFADCAPLAVKTVRCLITCCKHRWPTAGCRGRPRLGAPIIRAHRPRSPSRPTADPTAAHAKRLRYEWQAPLRPFGGAAVLAVRVFLRMCIVRLPSQDWGTRPPNDRGPNLLSTLASWVSTLGKTRPRRLVARLSHTRRHFLCYDVATRYPLPCFLRVATVPASLQPP